MVDPMEYQIKLTGTVEQLERYDYALADALMWLSGFEAENPMSGYPGDIQSLRRLRDEIRRGLPK